MGEDLKRRRAVAGWMADVWRLASERGITDAEAVIAFSHEAAVLLRAMVHSGDVRQAKIGAPVEVAKPVCAACGATPGVPELPCNLASGHVWRSGPVQNLIPRVQPKHAYTSHGQSCCNDLAFADIKPPILVATCGGPRTCHECQVEADVIHGARPDNLSD